MSRPARHLVRSAALVALATLGFASLTGCGNTYRPVVSAINPVGPSAQPEKYAVAISDPGGSNPGIVTLVDFSGDTVVITANIGVAPKYLVLDSGGTTGYTINGDGTLNSFGIVNTLLTSQVEALTLLANPPANATAVFPQGTTTFVTEPGRSAIAEYQSATSGNLGLKQEVSVANPTYVVGVASSPRVYALSSGSGTTGPQAVGLDSTTLSTVGSPITIGTNPVYGIMTADFKRAFIMNKGDGTVSVINVPSNQLDSSALVPDGLIHVGTAPLWADFAPTLSEMVVANAGSGTSNGSLSIISIPLCNASSPTTNPNCDANNPVDAQGFGTVLANVPVGISPIMVAALQDGTRAYVANSGGTGVCTSSSGTANGNCSISVVNLTSDTVTATIPLTCHPNWIAATTGAPTGKVYVTCGDSKNLTIIRTDTDAIDLTVPLQGAGISVRVSAS